MFLALTTRLAITLFVVSVALCPGQAPPETIAKIIAEGSGKNSQVMQHLHELVNGIGPRLTSSDGLTNACHWAVKKFAQFGAENPRLEKWGEFPVGFNRGAWFGRMVKPEAMELEFGTASWSPGTMGRLRGPLVELPTSVEDINSDRERYRNAWVIAGRTLRDEDGRRMRRSQRTKFLAELGICGIVRSTGDRIITSGRSNIDFENLPTLTTVNVKRKHFRKIKKHLDADTPVELEFDIRNFFKRGPIELFNVLAEIPGTEKPDELVIVGGHIDSWDGATGTTDNGTGVATTLEAARLLIASGAKPKRTIRFMLWSGEEQGLLGSRAYVKAHPEENDKISAVLVHDGGTNYAGGLPATAAMYDVLEPVLKPLFELDKDMPFKLRKVRSLPYPIGSDHDSYLGVGVPGFFWDQKGRAVYNRTHHTQFDTYDSAIPEYQEHTAKVVAIAALAIANLPEKLDRTNMRRGNRMGRRTNRRLLGVSFDDEMVITRVTENSAASRAGIQLGDKILTVDGTVIKDQFALAESIKDGKSKKIKLARKGKEIELTASWEKAKK